MTLAAFSDDYFRIANARFVRGYAPSDKETGIVVTTALWHALVATGDTSVINIYNQSFRIVGVVDESFRGLNASDGIDAWIPLTSLPALDGDPSLLSYRELDDLSVVVQPVVGARESALQPYIQRSSSRLADFHDGNRNGWHLEVKNAQPKFSELVRTTTGQAAFAPLLVLACVLLIAASNVANLFVVRAAARKRGLELRLALGISPGTLLLHECLELIALGAAGLVLGLTIGLFALQQFAQYPLIERLALRPSALSILAAVAAALLVVAMSALAPVLSVRKLRGADVIHQGQGITGHVVSRVQRVFLVLQFTLALAFTCIAIQLATAVRQQSKVDVGFDTKNLIAVSSPRGSAGRTPEQIVGDYNRVTAAVGSIAGVQAVTGSVSEFFGGYKTGRRPISAVRTDAISNQGVVASMDVVAPGYFAAIGLPILLGREFGQEDGPNSPKDIVVNSALAKVVAPNGSPIGMTIYEQGQFPLQIIGVATDVRATASQIVQPAYYRSLVQSPLPQFVVYARVSKFSQAYTTSIVSAIVKELPESVGRLHIHTADEQRRERDLPALTMFWLSVGLAAVAMFVTGLGLYGVASYATFARRKEHGVRAALGASPTKLAAMVLSEGLGWTALSSALSLRFVWVGMKVATAFVVGAQLIPVASTAALIGAYLVVVILALLLPARRAATVSPMEALRST